MDTLLATVKAALIAEGASPATADDMDAEYQDWRTKALARVERDRLERQAQMLLPLGAAVAAERCDCHKSTVYRRAKRARDKFSRFWPASATSPR